MLFENIISGDDKWGGFSDDNRLKYDLESDLNQMQSSLIHSLTWVRINSLPWEQPNNSNQQTYLF